MNWVLSRALIFSVSSVLVVAPATLFAQAGLPDPVPLEEVEPEPKPAPVPEYVPPAVEEVAPAVVAPPMAAAESEEAVDPNAFDIGLDGYVRAEYATLQNERFLGFRMASSDDARRNPFVGRNDGFALGSARLNVRASLRQLYLRLAFDGADVVYGDVDPVVGELTTRLKDAYLRYSFHPMLQVFAGRFKPPFDVEELTSEEDQLFVQRALESRGVERTEGYASDMPGFRPGRQTGLMIASNTPGWNYAFALTNGNGADANVNDNDTPAAWLRVSKVFGLAAQRDDEEGPATVVRGNTVLVGLSSYYNTLTSGVVPTRRRDREIGVGFDVSAHVSVFEFAGQVLAQRTTRLVSGRECLFSGGSGNCVEAPREDAIGGHAQVGVTIPGTGFTPAYRFALYDPRAMVKPEVIGNVTDATRVMHHTVGLRYRASTLPMIGWLEYTRSAEQDHRALPNDRIEAALQVTFK